MAVERTARAKVNLYLQITGRRSDGYHTLDSLFAFADIGDGLTAERSEALTLSIEGAFADDLRGEADNLTLRAARALADAAGDRERGAKLTLAKNLPVASGLGGGSADAAATLLALNEIWGLDWPVERLREIAVTLGADVPPCLFQKPIQVAGIGEQIALAKGVPACPIVIANPRVPLATASVFGAFAKSARPFSAPAAPLRAQGDIESFARALQERRNDLEPAAVALVPEIAEVLAYLASAPDCLLARMSGSGASCFGLFPSQNAARDMAERLAREKPCWWVRAGRVEGSEDACG